MSNAAPEGFFNSLLTLSWIRRSLGVPGYWSLSGYAKRKVKSAVSFIDDFERSVVRNVKDRDLDGVICGHIHAATIREFGGITYFNCGDWVDSCTAVVEHRDGSMAVIQWGARPPASRSLRRSTPSLAATATPHPYRRASRPELPTPPPASAGIIRGCVPLAHSASRGSPEVP